MQRSATDRAESFRGVGRTGLLLLASLTIVGLLFAWDNAPPLAREVAVAISAVLTIHLLDRFFLWRDLGERMSGLLRETVVRSHHLVASGSEVGLRNVWANRKAWAESVNAADAMSKAGTRLWFLGVSGTAELHLSTIFRAAYDRHSTGVDDVRVLLMDALCSPALFRAFLEAPVAKIKSILDADRTVTTRPDPYLERPLYTNFEAALNLIHQYPHSFQKRVRFYRHDPLLWLLVIDETIYVQQYSYSTLLRDNSTFCIGDALPVYEYNMTAGGCSPFEVYENHFETLWDTSDGDVAHTQARRHDSRQVIADSIAARRGWLSRVHRVLEARETHGRDLRVDPRVECNTNPLLALKWGGVLDPLRPFVCAIAPTGGLASN